MREHRPCEVAPPSCRYGKGAKPESTVIVNLFIFYREKLGYHRNTMAYLQLLTYSQLWYIIKPSCRKEGLEL